MALQVWLPLNGNLNNNGHLDTSITITNTGTVDNTGKIGQCYSYSGTYTYLNGSILGGLSQFSITLWAYITNSSYTLFTSEQGSYWQFVLYRNIIGIRDSSVGATGNRMDKGITALPLNVWTHVAIVYDNGIVYVYQNGSLKNTLTYHTGASMNEHNRLYLGADAANSVSSYPGNCKINDFRIYDHCLSVKEINELSKGLVLHYKLNTTNHNTLPLGLELYDSIQSDGHSWINTLIPYDSTKTTYKIKCKFSQPANIGQYDAVFGAYTNESCKTLRIIRGASNTLMWGYYNRQAGGGHCAGLTGTNSETKEVVMTSESLVCTVSGTSTTYTYGTSNGTNTTSIFYLFAQGIASGSISCKSKTILYYWTIWDGNTMLGNFIPATFFGEPGMYDTVTKKFFHNNGTGNFIMGNRTNIIEYEYLQCDTSSYIKTGIIPTTSTNFEMKYAIASLTAETVYFGCSTHSYYTGGTNYSLDMSKNGQAIYTFQNKAYDRTDYIVTANTPFTTQLFGNRFTIGGLSYPANRYTSTPNLEIYLFGRNVNGSVGTIKTGKLYYCKFWEGDTLIRDFVPVSYDGELGLFDKVELKFYANAGTGSFTAERLSEQIVNDCSGYRNDGIVVNNISTGDASPRYWASANLVGSYIRCPLYPFDETTISFWINRNSLTNTRQFIYTGWYGISIELTAGNGWQIYYTYNNSGSVSTVSCSPSLQLSANTWYHVALVIGKNGVASYINGVCQVRNTYKPPYYSTDEVQIGNYSTFKNFNAKLSDFRVYSTPLSDADIKELYDTSATIDNYGNLMCYEIIESDTTPSITKTGNFIVDKFIEFYDYICLSAGTYINTGLHYNNSDLCTAKTIIRYASGGTGRDLMGYSAAGRGYWGVTSGGTWERSSTLNLNDLNNDITKINNVIYTYSASTVNGTYTIGSIGSYYSVRTKYIYRKQLYKNNVLERDMYPALCGTTAGMYDIVYGVFYPCNNTRGVVGNDEGSKQTAKLYNDRFEINHVWEK